MAALPADYSRNGAPPIYDRYKLAKERPKFRGCWTAAVADPTARSFVPVASTAVPKAAPRPAAVPRAAPAPKPEPKLVEVPTSGVRLKILDRCRDLRSFITDDGTCTDKYGRVIGPPGHVVGYINFNEWTVGGPDESFWGSLLEEQILDKDDKQIGEVDFGRAWVRDQVGNTVCEMENTGECKGHDCSFIGQFEGFTFHDLKTVALYLIIVDPLMYNTVAG